MRFEAPGQSYGRGLTSAEITGRKHEKNFQRIPERIEIGWLKGRKLPIITQIISVSMFDEF